jgi:hypothetical protein
MWIGHGTGTGKPAGIWPTGLTGTGVVSVFHTCGHTVPVLAVSQVGHRLVTGRSSSRSVLLPPLPMSPSAPSPLAVRRPSQSYWITAGGECPSLARFLSAVLTSPSLCALQGVSAPRSLPFHVLTSPFLCAVQGVSAPLSLASFPCPDWPIPLCSPGHECPSLARFLCPDQSIPLCSTGSKWSSLPFVHGC